MNSAWQVVDCTQLEGQLSYVRGRLRVKRYCDSEETIVSDVPLTNIAVLLIGLHCNCSAGLLHQLATYGVSVLVCDWRAVPIAGFYSWANPATRVTARQRAQASMSLPRQKSMWAKIIKKKILGQSACLCVLEKAQGGQLKELAKSVRSGDPSNVEGQAARIYWKSLFASEENFRRTPGLGEGRNTLLDYGYMILRGFTEKAVISAGLNPAFGIHHVNGANYFCLADDLLEVFRPCVDVKVAQLPVDASLADRAVKGYLVESINRQFNGSGFTIPSVIEDFTQQYALYAEGKLDSIDIPQYVEA